MKPVLIAAVLGMVALLSGYPLETTIEPLYQVGQEKQKVDDPGLIGEWISYEGLKQKCQALFYIDSVHLSSGDKAKARELFQEATETGDYRSDEFITARFRLGQLSTK
jgi:hypothetical protein